MQAGSFTSPPKGANFEMGATVGKLFSLTRECRMLVLGLDGVGKTTFLYKLKLGEIVTTIPTIGFNVETINYKRLSLTMWDVGSRGRVRALWRHYYQNTQAVIWVSAASERDEGRLEEERFELHRLFNEDELRDAVLCVLANKMDLPNARSATQVAADLGLAELRARHVKVFATCATSGDGLYEALDWISTALNESPPPTNAELVHVNAAPVFTPAVAAAAVAAPAPAAVAAAASAPAPAEPSLIAGAQPGLTRDLAAIAPRGDPTSGVRLAIDKLGPESGDEFLAQFAAREPALVNTPWFHVVRLRLIHAQLVRLGRRAGVKWLHAELEALFKATGRATHVYHVTVVYFWLQLVDYFIALDKAQDVKASASDKPAPAAPSKSEFVAFVARHSELLQDSELLAEFYSVERILHDPASFTAFQLPDKKPFPSLVALS